VDVLENIDAMREYSSLRKQRGKRVVLVPTMGALHDGHGACIRMGQTVKNAAVVVSIFVNHAQFGPNEDFSSYPRTMETDLALCREWSVDAVFAPTQEVMYPAEARQRTWVNVDGLTEPLCGRRRPGHFRGVTTVVSKLFNIIQPDVAVFGQKDAQQVLVIREMIEHLNIPVKLKTASIAREKDGLARSSRNVRLNEEERTRAASIFGVLRKALDRINRGERDPSKLTDAVRCDIHNGGIGDVEYVDILDADDLSALETIEGKVILAVAVNVGKTRLIDNVVFRIGDDGMAEEETII